MNRRHFHLAGEGTTGAGGTGGAAQGANDKGAQGGAGAAGTGGAAGAAGAGAAAAGTAGAAGAAGAGQAAGAGAGSSFAGAAGQQGQTDGQGGKGSAGAAAPADLDKLTLPEGVTQIDQPLFDGFKAFAKEKQLAPGTAQELLNFYAKHIVDQDKAAIAAAEQRQKDQRKALEADPEIGGAKFQASLELARRAVLTLDREAKGLGTLLVKELDAVGLGDSIAASRLLVFIGEKLGEDKAKDGAGGTGAASGATGQSAEERARRRYARSLAAGEEK